MFRRHFCYLGHIFINCQQTHDAVQGYIAAWIQTWVALARIPEFGHVLNICAGKAVKCKPAQGADMAMQFIQWCRCKTWLGFCLGVILCRPDLRLFLAVLSTSWPFLTRDCMFHAFIVVYRWSCHSKRPNVSRCPEGISSFSCQSWLVLDVAGSLPSLGSDDDFEQRFYRADRRPPGWGNSVFCG